MRHLFALLMLALTSSIHAQDSFSGPNEFLLGGQVWKCDTSSVTGDTLFVPEDYGTIQSAIDACANGDIILVAPGEYNENLQANGKEFALASHYLTSCDTLDIYETVINGNGGVGLSIVQLEQHIKVIGFTITNCSSGIYYGGQDWNWRYDLYFSNLRLVGNSSHGINGYLWRTGNYLLNSVVSDNGSHGISMVNKGALYIGECLVENNQGHGIYNNQCGFLAACSKIRNNNGDGIYSTYWGPGFRQYRCIISGNAGDGIHARNTGAQGVYNCTIVANGEYGLRGTVAARNSIVHSNGSGVHLVDNGGDPGNQSQSSFEYILSESDLSGVGNIVGDPLLDEGFIPGAGSPAIAGGNPEIYDIGGYEGFNAYLTAPGMSIGAIQALELVYGCTEPESCNYSPEANVDDGSCVLSGCMDTEACNFNPVAECEGEACVYTCCPGPGCCDVGMHWDWELGMCQITNVADTNLDGCVQLNDLLDVLSAYGDCGVLENEVQVISNPNFEIADGIYNQWPELTIALRAAFSDSTGSSNIYRQIEGGEMGLNHSDGKLSFSLKASNGNCYTASGWVAVETNLTDDDLHAIVARYSRLTGEFSLAIDGEIMVVSAINSGDLADCNLYNGEIGFPSDKAWSLEEIGFYDFVWSEEMVASYADCVPLTSLDMESAQLLLPSGVSIDEVEELLSPYAPITVTGTSGFLPCE